MTEQKSNLVYIVEDDEFLGKIIDSHFKYTDLTTVLIKDGLEALETIKQKKPDLLILDIFIPGMNGLELLAELRKDESTKNIKVLVFSNNGEKESKDKAEELGAKFIIKFSTNPDEIVEMVKKELGE